MEDIKCSRMGKKTLRNVDALEKLKKDRPAKIPKKKKKLIASSAVSSANVIFLRKKGDKKILFYFVLTAQPSSEGHLRRKMQCIGQCPSHITLKKMGRDSECFKTTLCISNDPILKAFSEISSNTGIFSGTAKRGQRLPANKHRENAMMHVKEHIESFPVMEGHYTRKSSSKGCLDKNLSILKMFSLYEKWCAEEERKPVSQTVYRRYFCSNYNLSFYRPNGSVWNLCNIYFRKDPEQKEKKQQDYEDHQKMKGRLQPRQGTWQNKGTR
ncbi:hypothetical protein PR048_007121 [Dryococelus australis]|uniref:Uncharacterized protein n=1 Tax=Dryococelus australis TaxID=614101 RepID=A0ABQ9ICQ5_9NEOP|nr:hypothetical protein PR048_007121 [Dryococelus australis]